MITIPLYVHNCAHRAWDNYYLYIGPGIIIHNFMDRAWVLCWVVHNLIHRAGTLIIISWLVRKSECWHAQVHSMFNSINWPRNLCIQIDIIFNEVFFIWDFLEAIFKKVPKTHRMLLSNFLSSLGSFAKTFPKKSKMQHILEYNIYLVK